MLTLVSCVSDLSHQYQWTSVACTCQQDPEDVCVWKPGHHGAPSIALFPLAPPPYGPASFASTYVGRKEQQEHPAMIPGPRTRSAL